MKVFIIDDDEFILDLYKRVFKLEKHEVESAVDGVEAWTKLGTMSQLPDVMILDIMMPNMNGFDLLKKIKSDSAFSKIPILILSNLYSREDRKKGLDLGAAVYLVKSEHDPKEIVTHALAAIGN